MVCVGCCQTTSGIGGSFDISFVYGLSHAAPEYRRGVASLVFGLQLGHSHLSCFAHFSVGLGFCPSGVLIRGGGLFAAFAPR